MPDSALCLVKPNIRGPTGTPIYCLQPVTQSKQGFGGVDVYAEEDLLKSDIASEKLYMMIEKGV